MKLKINETEYDFSQGETLLSVLARNGFVVGSCGVGSCGKCLAVVNGAETLSCRYYPKEGDKVVIDEKRGYFGLTIEKNGEKGGEVVDFAVDIGTTTIAVAEVSNGKVTDTALAVNPQAAYGSDVISRINRWNDDSVPLHSLVVDAVEKMILLLVGGRRIGRVLFTGNTAMLHMLWGRDCRGMGVAPYTAAFLAPQRCNAADLGFSFSAEAESACCIASFVGGDIVCGMLDVGTPRHGYNLLVDLGTNAETVLFSKERATCTSAAAGPCLEGASIECGSGSVEGAICSVRLGQNEKITTISGEPKTICGTGLIDAVAELLRCGFIDETGKTAEKRRYLTKDVYISQNDVREFQLAKSAIRSAVDTLILREGITADDINKCYVAGGFSAKVNIINAIYVGLLPMSLAGKYVAVGNSALSGAVKILGGEKNAVPSKECRYIDLSADEEFFDKFIINMQFAKE